MIMMIRCYDYDVDIRSKNLNKNEISLSKSILTTKIRVLLNICKIYLFKALFNLKLDENYHKNH